MKKESNYILFGALIVVVLIGFLGNRQKTMMKDNAVLGHAIIKEVKFRYKDAGILFVYTFNCYGEEIINTSLFDCDYSKIKDLRLYFVNRELPIIYASNSCTSSRIIFDKKIAQEYQLDGQLSAADGESIRILDSIKIH